MSLAYRREIDGLRALAVVSVVLFHAGFQEPSGGFLGVDVFFVISGFLITSIILSEQDSGAFTLSGFYERRARRILPALFTVVIASLAFAYFFLMPDDFAHFGKSVASTSIFGSNIFFWLQDDYFAPNAKYIPLLHTWSLAVEEQFYLLFPLLLLVFVPAKQHSLILVIAIIGITSLAWAHWGSLHAPSANFYLLPSRMWELAAGALLAVVLRRTEPAAYFGTLTLNVLSVVGLALVLGALVVFDETTPLPSAYSVIPVAGTALLLATATSDTLVGRVLGSKPMVIVGLTSYSIYLWHVPLLSFAEHVLLEPSRLPVKLTIVSATFVLAFITWKLVETPFRRRHNFSRKTIFVGSLVISVFLAAVGTLIAISGGYPNRFSSPYLNFSKLKEQEDSWRFVREALDTKKQDGSVVRQGGHESNLPKVAILGNSHAKDLYNVLRESGLAIGLEPIVTNRLCEEFSERTQAYRDCNRKYEHPLNRWDADFYIVAPRWNPRKVRKLPELLSHLERLHKPIAVFGNKAEFDDVPKCFAKHILIDGNQSVPNLRRIEDECGTTLKKDKIGPFNEQIREITEASWACLYRPDDPGVPR